MSLDLLGILVLAIAAATGALTGALRQLVHLGAVALGALVAPHLGRLLEGAARRVVEPGGAARAVAAFAGFALTFALVSVAGHLLLQGRTGRAARSASDRGLGALLGGGQAAVGTWAALSLLVVWDRPVGPRGLRLDPADGDLAGFAREHNLLDSAAPGQARELRERLPALREALERPVERADEAARKAGGALRRVEKAAEDAAR